MRQRSGDPGVLRIELVRAEENSPRREPWGSCEIAKPRHGAEDCEGAVFRPLPGALPLTPHSHGLRRGLLSFALRAGECPCALPGGEPRVARTFSSPKGER